MTDHTRSAMGVLVIDLIIQERENDGTRLH
jgi:hypothetical protein